MISKNRFFTFAAAATLAACSGCATATDAARQNAKAYANAFGLSALTAEAIGMGSSEISAETALAKASTSDSSIQAATMLALLNASDTACEAYMSRVVTQSNTVSSALGVSSLALSSAAALSSPTRSANLLSGVAGFATGTEKQLASTVLGGKSPALIYKAVSASRRKERSRIVTLYSASGFHIAAAELADYHALCGPTVGVNALEDAVNKAAIDAPKEGVAEGVEAVMAMQQAANAQIIN